MRIARKKRNEIACKLEMLSNDLEAATQTLNAICVAVGGNDTVPVGPRALFCPCKELIRISNELKELTDKVYQVIDEGAR